jgi:hypothetical protein
MSRSALGLTSKGSRRLCDACRERKPLFRYRGEVRADRSTLCFECFRPETNRARSRNRLTPGLCGFSMRVAPATLSRAAVAAS